MKKDEHSPEHSLNNSKSSVKYEEQEAMEAMLDPLQKKNSMQF